MVSSMGMQLKILENEQCNSKARFNNKNDFVVAYAVVNQQNIFSHNLITSKLRLARKKIYLYRASS